VGWKIVRAMRREATRGLARSSEKNSLLRERPFFVLEYIERVKKVVLIRREPSGSLTVRRSFDGDAGAVQLTGGPLGRNAVRWNENARPSERNRS
jgi:hypothetical protein